ncbi:unnamed protein product, partial [Scytosiphon promiscuus]
MFERSEGGKGRALESAGQAPSAEYRPCQRRKNIRHARHNTHSNCTIAHRQSRGILQRRASMAAAAGAVDGRTCSGGGAGWIRRWRQVPSRHLQQPDGPMFRQQQQWQPLAVPRGSESIVNALARLQQGPLAGSPCEVKRSVPPERQVLSRDTAKNVNGDGGGGGGGGGGGQDRCAPRSFSHGHGGAGMRAARETATRDSQRSRESDSEAVRVAVRVRPMSEREIAAGLQRIVSVECEAVLSVVDPTAFAAALALERGGKEQVESSMWAKQFSFDRCFGCDENATGGGQQEQVFEEIGAGVVDQAFSGYNATVFAYGQTGSGKSYTMMGSGAALDASVDPDDYGLIPRICARIFERLHQAGNEGAAQSPCQSTSDRNIPGGRRMAEGSGEQEILREDGSPCRTGHCEALLGGADGPAYRDNKNNNTSINNHHYSNSEMSVHEGNCNDQSRPAKTVAPLRGQNGTLAAAQASHRDVGCAAGANPLGFPAANSGPDPSDWWAQFSVEVSYLEIYNESLRDLFNPGTPAAAGIGGAGVSQGAGGSSIPAVGCGASGTGLRLREDPSSGIYVEGLTSIAVSSWDEMSQLLTYGGGERTVAATNANDWSSRSHAVFTLTLRQTSETMSPTGHSRESWEACSSINLVDLAGSERVSHTGATGLRLQEAGSINRSLAALSDVIKALSEAQRRHRDGKSPNRQSSPGRGKRGGAAAAVPPVSSPKVFIPYRNSVLTRLLKESLGGNSRTVMLACVSPCNAHYEETLGTLRYAERAKRVRTRAIANARRGMSEREAGIEQAALIGRLTTEVLDLKRQLAEATANNAADLLSPRPEPALTTGQLPPSPGSRRDTEGVEPPGAEASLRLGGLLTAQAVNGDQGYIYVVDPALQVEIERLRDTVADRERVIQNMELNGRRNLRAVRELGEGRRSKPATHLHRSSDGSCSSSSATSSSSASAQQCAVVPPGDSEQTGGSIELSQDTGAGEANLGLPESEQRQSRMRLLNLNQDPMFSECVAFPIRDGGTYTVVGSGEDADVQLAGSDVLPRHALIKVEPDGSAVLTPMPGACVRINGVPLGVDSEALAGQGQDAESGVLSPVTGCNEGGGVLHHNYRVLFGSRHFFRVDCGPETSAAQEKHDVGVGDNVSTVAAPRVSVDWDFAQKEVRDSTLASSVNGATVKTETVLMPLSPPLGTAGGLKPAASTRKRVEKGGSETEKALSSGSASDAQYCEGDGEAVSERRLAGVSNECLQGSRTPVSERVESVVLARTSSGCAPPLSSVVMSQRERSAATGDPSVPEQHPCATDPPSPAPASDPLPGLVEAATVVTEEEGAQKLPEEALPQGGLTPEQLPSVADNGVLPCPPRRSSAGCSRGESAAEVAATAASAAPRGLESDGSIDGDGTPAEEQGPSITTDNIEPIKIAGPSPPRSEKTHEDGTLGSAPQELTPPRSPTPASTTPTACGSAAATAVYAHKVKAALDIELQRAREAWRGAEGELERSQDERDELRAALEVVQDQARDRRRADRKEKRDLDKLKAQAEYRARALESDRDRLRQMLSKSDEEVADLRGQLREAQAAVAGTTATATAATTATTTESFTNTTTSVISPEREAAEGLLMVRIVSPSCRSEPWTTTPTPTAVATAECPGVDIRGGQGVATETVGDADPDAATGDIISKARMAGRSSTLASLSTAEQPCSQAAFVETKEESSEEVGEGGSPGCPAPAPFAVEEAASRRTGWSKSAGREDSTITPDEDLLRRRQGTLQQ